ncbi:hypothetical protein HHJ78_06595 [Mobiluncus mulieris]|uniref:Uncharacterized protein n=1 Tax=Mobiluncus mulieris TaxID=2052 RepID=A0A7Y0U1G1_9ACTO|nr:hypothetical protein [Mobiluncus mulieris]NMW65204.1 hypothetical protein [Mobiluncus mulieris]
MFFESSGFEEGADAVVDEVAESEGGASKVFETVESNIAGSLSVRFFDVYKPIITKAPTPNPPPPPRQHPKTPKTPATPNP